MFQCKKGMVLYRARDGPSRARTPRGAGRARPSRSGYVRGRRSTGRKPDPASSRLDELVAVVVGARGGAPMGNKKKNKKRAAAKKASSGPPEAATHEPVAAPFNNFPFCIYIGAHWLARCTRLTTRRWAGTHCCYRLGRCAADGCASVDRTPCGSVSR